MIKGNNMKIKILKNSILTILSLTTFDVLSENIKGNLPPILDYYPNCAYNIIEKASAKKTTQQPMARETTEFLLARLRAQAVKVGADAIILTDRQAEKSINSYESTRMGKTKTIFTISFHAEFIKNCEETFKQHTKATAFNHQGIKTLSSKKKVLVSRTIEIKYPEKSKLHRPTLNNQDVSLENGLYGIKIGSEYDDVLEKFGDPSIQLDLLDDELLVGYGRRHWLHFQTGTLVKIQSESKYLSQTILNKIPFFDFFDDFSWRINNQFSHGQSLQEIKTALNLDTPLNANDQLILTHQGNTLVLNFVFKKNIKTLKKEYSLNNFEMYKSDYQIRDVDVKDIRKKQNIVIAQTYKKLQQEKEIDWKYIEKQLGKPIGRITLTADSALIIYNTHLLVKVKRSELNTVHYIQGALLDDKDFYSKNSFWALDNFKQDLSIEELRPYFQESAHEYEGEVKIQADAFNLSLYFSQRQSRSSLEEAKLIIY
ncbi:MAG: hypothetical protein ACI9LM_004177 [Alteromonadaceae bacterium]|jgi:hypothetical protein